MDSEVSNIKFDIDDEKKNYHKFNKIISTSFKYLKVNAKDLDSQLLANLVKKIWNSIIDYYIALNLTSMTDIRLFKFHKYFRLGDDFEGDLRLVRLHHGIFHWKTIRKAKLSDVLAFIYSLERRVDDYHVKRMTQLNTELTEAKDAQIRHKRINKGHRDWDDLYRETKAK